MVYRHADKIVNLRQGLPIGVATRTEGIERQILSLGRAERLAANTDTAGILGPIK